MTIGVFLWSPAQALAPLEPRKDETVIEKPCNEDTEVRCNCYLFVKTKYPDIPRTKDLRANMTNAQEGVVVLFTYKRGQPDEVRHYAILDTILAGGFLVSECNFGGDFCGQRFIRYGDVAVDGYFNPAI